MYAALWRRLPGPLAVRLLLVGLLAAVILLLLFVVLFPAVGPYLPFNDVTVDPSSPPRPSP